MWSWATLAEIYVDQQQDMYNLAQILIEISIDKEDLSEETSMHVNETVSAGLSGEHPPRGS